MHQKTQNINFGDLKDITYYPTSKYFGITPKNSSFQYVEGFDFFIASIEQQIDKIIPDSIKTQIEKEPQNLQNIFKTLFTKLPIFQYSYHESCPYNIAVTFLSYCDYTQGVGRYVPDMLSRWLIPGKLLSIEAERSLAFLFKSFPQKPLFFCQYYLDIKTDKELSIALKNIDKTIHELKINILAVYYARYIISLKKLTLEQQTTMIESYISSLLDNKVKDFNAHDQMQQFLLKLSAEQKYHQVKENISSLMNSRPKNFDHDVFYEIRHFTVLFRDKFTVNRDPRHISRVIAFQYLFKKTILQSIKKAPNERHLSLKILKTRIKSDDKERTVIGILIAMNFVKDTERFDKRHVLEAVKTYIPDIHYVKESYILERSEEKVRSIYLEIEKKDGGNFSFEEIKELKNELSKEVQDRVENVVHPIFMPRNEEEIIRNIIILSKQLKYVRDIPQIIITYDKQTDKEIIFTVILVRLLKQNSESLKNIFKEASHLKIIQDEIKIIGYLKRYPKEANIFRIYLGKSPFFRKDFSLDLQKARRRVVHEITYLVGEFRDYNGGMIVKQSEALEKLRILLKHLGKRGEFLLENFFYSLRPAVMQSVLSTKIMKALFLLFLDAIDQDSSTEAYTLNVQIETRYLLIMMSAPASGFKEYVQNSIQKLKIPSSDLTSSLVNIYEVTTLGYAYRFDDMEQASLFKKTIKEALDHWKEKFFCKLNSL